MGVTAPVRLTGRQQQILVLFSEGGTDREVAGQLGIGVETVRCHSKRIRQQLGVRSKCEAVAVAFRVGMLQ